MAAIATIASGRDPAYYTRTHLAQLGSQGHGA
jgi:hypothetical protein